MSDMEKIEETVSEIVEIKKNYGKGAALVLCGAFVGSAITWFVADKILSKKFEAKFDAELEESMAFLAQRMNTEKPIVVSNEDPQEFFSEDESVVSEPLDEVQGERVLSSAVETAEILQKQRVEYNKVLTTEEYLDTPDILEDETLEEPWSPGEDISVITRDLFMENPTEWDQKTITYFADDGVIDEAGDFMPEQEDKIGSGKPPFGQMSEDANIVFLRNKKLKLEFEVIFDAGNATDFLSHALVDLYRPSQRQ